MNGYSTSKKQNKTNRAGLFTQGQKLMKLSKISLKKDFFKTTENLSHYIGCREPPEYLFIAKGLYLERKNSFMSTPDLAGRPTTNYTILLPLLLSPVHVWREYQNVLQNTLWQRWKQWSFRGLPLLLPLVSNTSVPSTSNHRNKNIKTWRLFCFINWTLHRSCN